jgi:uncharacterized protein (TIGR03083 family)
MDWSWVGPPLDVRPLFPRERAAFLTLLQALDDDDWQAPTICPGWRVHDVVAHVVHDGLRRLSGMRDGHPSWDPRPAEDLAVYLARVNQEFVDVAVRWSPPVLIDLVDHLGRQLDRMWAGLDLRERGLVVSWALPDEPAPVWLDVAREYTEFWVHQQQVRDAVGRPGATDEALAGAVVDTFVRALPYTLRGVAAPVGTAAHLEVTGPGGGVWSVVRRSGTWAVGRGRSPDPAALVRLSADTLWRVATRGITVRSARERATVSGDLTLGATVLELVSIIR